MSAAARQRTCALCGKELTEGDLVNIEVILAAGWPPLYIAVHWGESTFIHRKKEEN